MADKEKDAVPDSILGDIRPRTPESGAAPAGESRHHDDDAADRSIVGGSEPEQTGHVGSRDVTEGTTGGTGAVTGGTRNYRQGTGATGTDIGNRPE